MHQSALLAINAGSSSIKFALYARSGAGTQRALVRGQIDGVGAAPHFVARDASGADIGGREWRSEDNASHEDILSHLLTWIDDHLGEAQLAAVGHRVVHGGRRLVEPTIVTPEILTELESLVPLAPLHQPHSLHGIRAIASARPNLPQVACFDTAFHRTIPDLTRRSAIPRALHEEGIERYGFHGLSYEFIVNSLKDSAKGRVVVAHLGAGASLCAIRDGASVATTMSFSPLDGLMMATRCGSLDPAVVLYLARQGRSLDEIEHLLYRQSGLLGVSGITGDMEALIASDDPRAREALDLFSYRAAIETAGLAGALGGLDRLVFTAGIGERAPTIRAEICTRLAWLGLRLDARANAENAARIGAPDSLVDVRVIATDEQQMIARHTLSLIGRD
jgi:acetate kinase